MAEMKEAVATYPEPRKEPPEPLVVEKPWGRFIQYVLNEPVTVKILEVKAGEQLSLQAHNHRSELWVPLDEGACVEIDGQIIRPKPLQPVFIPVGANTGLSARTNLIACWKSPSASSTRTTSFALRTSMGGCDAMPKRKWRRFNIVVEKHPDGYVAYPLGLKSVVVGEGDTFEEALVDVVSAVRFHIETFGEEVCCNETPA
jgi:mannose-6-phosphate isomerase-like protein (cupin superfamily)